MIVWLIGLSGAGKSTVGTLVYDRVQAVHPNTVFLDGDILRDVWRDRLPHDIEGRRRNAERISHLCAMLDRQGIHAVAAVLSIFPDWQAWNRQTFSRYYEVFLDVPMEVVKARDAKGLYAAAERGEMPNVVGIDIPMPVPPQADLHLRPPEVLMDPAAMAAMIVDKSGILEPVPAPPYPYAAPAPFVEKIDYSYAACAVPGYVDGWRQAREAAQKRAARRAMDLPAAQASDGAALPLSTLLAGDGPDRPWLERLIQKYEVFGRLFRAYGPDGRRQEGADTATVGEYLAFARVLAARTATPGAEEGLQPLSTWLKLMDALCSLPPDAFTPDEAAVLACLIGQERTLVDRLAGQEP